jgi:gliding motility-associated lipoprotein GldH
LQKPQVLKKYFLLLAPVYLLLIQSCNTADLFEKNVAIPKYQWDYTYTPAVQFNITDTASWYNIYLVVRHTEAYGFNNIWVKISSKAPGDSALSTQQFDLPLASQNEWLGRGMDDIYEHRILLNSRPAKFKQPGNYTVTIEHVMRENPLRHVMNVGLRLEKVKQ